MAAGKQREKKEKVHGEYALLRHTPSDIFLQPVPTSKQSIQLWDHQWINPSRSKRSHDPIISQHHQQTFNRWAFCKDFMTLPSENDIFNFTQIDSGGKLEVILCTFIFNTFGFKWSGKYYLYSQKYDYNHILHALLHSLPNTSFF
jgi:hypothetical protein